MQLAFYRDGTTLLDWVVRLGTWSRYSHCELIFSDGKWCSSSANEGGVYLRNYRPTGHWDYIDVSGLVDEDSARYYVEALVGMKYDYLGVARFVIPWLKHDLERWFCSELCAYTLMVSGFPVPSGRDAYIYSPARLYKVLSAQVASLRQTS
jgi:hypothetical protein